MSSFFLSSKEKENNKVTFFRCPKLKNYQNSLEFFHFSAKHSKDGNSISDVKLKENYINNNYEDCNIRK